MTSGQTIAGRGVDAVRAAIAAMKDGSGDYAALKEAVAAAEFAPRASARNEEELAANWDYISNPDSFTDTVGVAQWQRVLTRGQVKELKGMAKFVGEDPGLSPVAPPSTDEQVL